MTTPFKQALSICGLSQSEAAVFLGVRPDTIASWCAGRNRVPDGVWEQMAALYDLMDEASEEAVDLIKEKSPDNVEFSYSGNHGKWPSVRCAMTMEAMVRLRIAES